MCKGTFNKYTGELKKPAQWMPLVPEEFGIKFIVATGVNDARSTATALTRAQQHVMRQFAEDMPATKLFMNIETFQDGSRHGSGWSDKPQDVTSQTTHWHCYQTETRFHEAFKAMTNDSKANVMIIMGNRFDDNLQKTLKAAKKLHENNNTRIYALPLTTAENVQNAYKELAESTGGIALSNIELRDGVPAVDDLLKELMQTIVANEIGIDQKALPSPANENMSNVRKQLLEHNQ